MVGVRLSVAQQLPEAPDAAITASALALDTGLAHREVVTSLNALRELGHVERLVPGDGPRDTPVARWFRTEEALDA